ncbi:YdcF family protein [Litchfieldia alkalitelluris]|uniref:YdcF family protein n=1 Tax=Litchfieldia alkalitelluris TaxID=304268 RepID=UPI001F16FC19|nr:YdcF family protein [Litchfieldia alkalitelluris]
MKWKQNKKLLTVLLCLVSLGLLYVVYLQFNMYIATKQEIPKNADYMIILGARVKGTTPSLSLQYRIDAAEKYLKNNPKTIAVASGGQGNGEDISEAESIKRELVKSGINESRILIEDQSTSTNENIMFSKDLLTVGMKTGVVVTNDYHLFRAKLIGSDYDLELVGIPAKTPKIAIPKSYIREYLALTKYYLLKYLT